MTTSAMEILPSFLQRCCGKERDITIQPTSSGDWKSLPQLRNLPAQVACQSPWGTFADVAVTYSRWAESL